MGSGVQPDFLISKAKGEKMRQSLICSVIAVAAVLPASGIPLFFLSTDETSFGLLGGTISNTGDSVVVGNVGATTTITGFGPGTATGTVYPSPTDATVEAAYAAFESDYSTAVALTPSAGVFSGGTQAFTGTTGNNVYASIGAVSTAAGGIVLTFNAQSQSNVVFVIQVDGSLTVNNAITFVLENGALASNIFWIIGGSDGIPAAGASAATIDPVGAPITWDGSILAGGTGGTFTMSSIGPSSALAGTVNGCVFTNAANTLAGETDINGCFESSASGTPEPGTAGLVSLGGLLGVFVWRKLRL
jgi:hypothetical protein